MSKTAMRLLASKPRIMSTKHGKCDVELGTALGPVSITFLIEPLSLTSSQHHVVPQPPSKHIMCNYSKVFDNYEDTKTLL